MPRYKLIIEYDGGPYCGWQIQDNSPSAGRWRPRQAICGETVRVQGAGRTDAGVHALAGGALRHAKPGPGRLRTGQRASAAASIGVLSAEIVPDDLTRGSRQPGGIRIASAIAGQPRARYGSGGCPGRSIATQCMKAAGRQA